MNKTQPIDILRDVFSTHKKKRDVLAHHNSMTKAEFIGYVSCFVIISKL
jgi:hypothetical protein